jgi:hypothetical protein
MEKLILNTEILSKMKVDLNKIYIGFDKVNGDILKIEEIVLKILDGDILEEDICNMYRILTDIEMYIFLKEDIENVSKEEIYNNVKIDIIEKYMYDFYVYIESIKKEFEENTFIYNFVRSSIYYFYGYKYYMKFNNSDSQTNLKLERARIKLLKYIEKLEKENKYYDYNEDKEKLYFKLFREWYAVNLNNIGRDIVEEGSFKIIEEILKNSSIYTEKYLENKKFFEEIEKNNITFDYSFDYIEVLNRMYRNIEEKEKEEYFKIFEDMINEKRINVKNENGKRGYVIYRNKNYMMLNKKDNEYRNVITFMHELRPCNGK